MIAQGPRKASGQRGLAVRGADWYNSPNLRPREGAGGTGLALVLCTGAALRRPSAWPAMRHREGCFSPAVWPRAPTARAGWNNPAHRGPALAVGALGHA